MAVGAARCCGSADLRPWARGPAIRISACSSAVSRKPRGWWHGFKSVIWAQWLSDRWSRTSRGKHQYRPVADQRCIPTRGHQTDGQAPQEHRALIQCAVRAVISRRIWQRLLRHSGFAPCRYDPVARDKVAGVVQSDRLVRYAKNVLRDVPGWRFRGKSHRPHP
jgi:hypothetical protein